eukprot:TRINITY_DN1222_c0_g5_i2.p1 TRINITY_DN1222_c0_g5~~TRINITY_DN1222_c0_g5_i2.p1  ORF type:complete len:215 (+),score=50.20 TRINITY_DN1222_c0_g5_i2:107-751(+)
MGLTAHVMTRFYRAPEVILLEKYSTAVDVWGAGCVFGELLQTVREVKKNFKDRSPLFAGEYCFPLTQPPEEVKQRARTEREHIFPLPDDQMTKIVATLGHPSAQSTAFIQNKSAMKYMQLLSACKTEGIDSAVPNMEDEERDLLGKLLEFSPELRITAKEALAHPYFDSVREEEEVKGDVIEMEAVDERKDKRAILKKYCIDFAYADSLNCRGF